MSPRSNGTYIVVAGHRRLAAAALAGIGELECSVREMDDVARNEAMVTENIARCDLAALEEAAPKLGCSQSHVSKRLALLGLPSSVQAEIDSVGITVGDGVELAKLADPARVEAARQNSRRSGRTMAEAVKEQQRAIKADEDRRKAFEGLRAEGVKIVADPPRYGWYDRKEKPLGKGYGHVDVTRACHAKERCHAAAVDAEGTIVYVCVNPRRHAKDDDAQSAATKAAKAAETKKTSRA
ncbi:MAG: ParB/RepB/Spo0J family partition protein [Acidimicrobiales bacterium]